MPESAGRRHDRHRVVAFAGPSLHRELAGAGGAAWDALLARVDLRPPARRGDLLAAAAERPDALVLLDGYYFTVPAVIHKEILYALEAGARVLGAASIGALRAAELEPLGMEGVGRVFGWYRDGVLDGDDEVAVRHLPASHGYRPMTVALVELRAAVAELAERGRLAREDGARLVAAVKALPFHDRSPERIRSLAAECLNGAADALARSLGRTRLKAQDARAALEAALGAGPPDPPPARSDPALATAFLSACKERHVRLPALGPGLPGPSALELCHALLALHPAAPELVRAVRLRWLLAAADGAEGPEPGRVDALAAALEERLAARFGGAVLPHGELREEAALQARAEAARRRAGGIDAALAELVRDLGLDRSRPPEASLLPLLAADPSGLPPWLLVRAALATGAAGPAWESAALAAQVARCHGRSTGGQRPSWSALLDVGAALWDCAPAAVLSEAARRGLFPGDGTTPGLREALALVAAAERLPRPINDYPRSRERLRQAPLAPDLDLPGL